MQKAYLFLIVALILTSLLIMYNQLGGFNEPVITYEPMKQYNFVGKRYLGSLEGQAFETLFAEMKDIKLNNGFAGALTLLWNGEPDSEADSVEVFVGIELLAGDDLPVQLDHLRLEMDGLIRATLSGHASVLPSPSSVVRKIRDFAAEHQYHLQDIVIDRYLSDSVVHTEIPVKIPTQ